MSRSALSVLIRDERGVAAVEFAIIAPAMAGIAAASFLVWEGIDRRRDMERALKVGAEYYLNGGVDDAAAVQVATTAWSGKPEDGAVETERVCRCGDTVVACSDLCPASKPPAVYVRLLASGSQPDALVYESISGERVVRVR